MVKSFVAVSPSQAVLGITIYNNNYHNVSLVTIQSAPLSDLILQVLSVPSHRSGYQETIIIIIYIIIHFFTCDKINSGFFKSILANPISPRACPRPSTTAKMVLVD